LAEILNCPKCGARLVAADRVQGPFACPRCQAVFPGEESAAETEVTAITALTRQPEHAREDDTGIQEQPDKSEPDLSTPGLSDAARRPAEFPALDGVRILVVLALVLAILTGFTFRTNNPGDYLGPVALVCTAITTLLIPVAVFRRDAPRAELHPIDVLAAGCSVFGLTAVGAFILFFLACAVTK
jgi:uncharacterized Zn finger protein (UPF0148 family)